MQPIQPVRRTAGLNEQHQQHHDRNSSQGHYQSNDTPVPRTTGSRFDCLEIENDDTVHTLADGCMVTKCPEFETDQEGFLSRIDEFT